MKLQLVIRRAKASAGLTWLQQGWQLIRQQGRLVAMCWVMYLLNIVGVLIHPIIGVIVSLLSVFLLAGFYQAVVNVMQQRSIVLKDLWLPLQDKVQRPALLRLAAFNLLCTIPLQLAGAPIAEGMVGGQLELLPMLLFVSLLCINTMLFAYAVPIVYFLREQRIWPTLLASFMACWRNVSSLTVFGLVSCLLLATGPVTFLLSYVIVLPLLSVSFFLSFREFFVLAPESNSTVQSEQGDTFEV